MKPKHLFFLMVAACVITTIALVLFKGNANSPQQPVEPQPAADSPTPVETAPTPPKATPTASGRKTGHNHPAVPVIKRNSGWM